MFRASCNPQTLTRGGLLAAVAFTVILLPFLSGRAQERPDRPAEPPALAQQQQAQSAAAQQDLAGKAAALEVQRAELEMRLKQLHDAIQHLKAKTNPQAAAGSTSSTTGSNSSSSTSSFGTTSGGGKAIGQPATKALGSVEQRLDHVEKKLDTLLWEITNLRRDLTRPGAGGSSPMISPPATPRNYYPTPSSSGSPYTKPVPAPQPAPPGPAPADAVPRNFTQPAADPAK
jgi:hypothetical protein